MLDSIVAVLAANLPAGVNVEIFDRAFGTRDVDYATLPYPSVLVAAHRLTSDGDYAPPVAVGQWVAVCITRDDDPAAGLSSGDTALNLAATVMAIADRQRWQDRAYTLPSNLRIDSMDVRALDERDLSGWVVRWDQSFELTFPAEAREQFKRLGITAQMGDANTPDVEALYVVPEEPVP
jgi:hypothetical protein